MTLLLVLGVVIHGVGFVFLSTQQHDISLFSDVTFSLVLIVVICELWDKQQFRFCGALSVGGDFVKSLHRLCLLSVIQRIANGAMESSRERDCSIEIEKPPWECRGRTAVAMKGSPKKMKKILQNPLKILKCFSQIC